jgi:hypothetical protein
MRARSSGFCTSSASAKREELGVSDDTIVVGAVGRLVAEKGYPELFDAMTKRVDEGAHPVVGHRRDHRRDRGGDSRVAALVLVAVGYIGAAIALIVLRHVRTSLRSG